MFIFPRPSVGRLAALFASVALPCLTLEAADLNLFPRATITVDGLGDDWAGITPIIVDSQESMQSDASYPANQDITAVYVAVDDKYVYCRIDVAGNYDLTTAHDSGPTIHFDNVNNELATRISSRVWMIEDVVSGAVFKWVNGREVPWNERPRGDGAAVGRIAEMRIPLSAFADVDMQNLYANYYIGGEESSDQTDTLTQPFHSAWRVTEIYLATLGYAPDHEGLQYWIGNLQGGGWTPTEVAQSFFDAPLVQDLYPAEQGNDALIEALYQNIFGRVADAEGKAYWLSELNAGHVTRNQMIIALINGGWANPEAAADMARFGNRVWVGLVFAAEQDAREREIVYSDLSEEQQTKLRTLGAQVLATVTADTATRDAAIASIQGLLDTLFAEQDGR
jgi:hypothetical protein